MNELQILQTWTFISECPVPKGVTDMLVSGEEAIVAYKTVRDSAVLTNKRIIIRDEQGLTGQKVENYSIPYSSIIMWSTGHTEVDLWTRAGHYRINLEKGVNIGKFDKYIATAALNK